MELVSFLVSSIVDQLVNELVGLFVRHNLDGNITMDLNEVQCISLWTVFIRHSATCCYEQSSENFGFLEVCTFVF